MVLVRYGRVALVVRVFKMRFFIQLVEVASGGLGFQMPCEPALGKSERICERAPDAIYCTGSGKCVWCLGAGKKSEGEGGRNEGGGGGGNGEGERVGS